MSRFQNITSIPSKVVTEDELTPVAKISRFFHKPLLVANNHYIAYTTSKAGVIRVIDQENADHIALNSEDAGAGTHIEHLDLREISKTQSILVASAADIVVWTFNTDKELDQDVKYVKITKTANESRSLMKIWSTVGSNPTVRIVYATFNQESYTSTVTVSEIDGSVVSEVQVEGLVKDFGFSGASSSKLLILTVSGDVWCWILDGTDDANLSRVTQFDGRNPVSVSLINQGLALTVGDGKLQVSAIDSPAYESYGLNLSSGGTTAITQCVYLAPFLFFLDSSQNALSVVELGSSSLKGQSLKFESIIRLSYGFDLLGFAVSKDESNSDPAKRSLDLYLISSKGVYINTTNASALYKNTPSIEQSRSNGTPTSDENKKESTTEAPKETSEDLPEDVTKDEFAKESSTETSSETSTETSKETTTGTTKDTETSTVEDIAKQTAKQTAKHTSDGTFEEVPQKLTKSDVTNGISSPTLSSTKTATPIQKNSSQRPVPVPKEISSPHSNSHAQARQPLAQAPSPQSYAPIALKTTNNQLLESYSHDDFKVKKYSLNEILASGYFVTKKEHAQLQKQVSRLEQKLAQFDKKFNESKTATGAVKDVNELGLNGHSKSEHKKTPQSSMKSKDTADTAYSPRSSTPIRSPSLNDPRPKSSQKSSRTKAAEPASTFDRDIVVKASSFESHVSAMVSAYQSAPEKLDKLISDFVENLDMDLEYMGDTQDDAYRDYVYLSAVACLVSASVITETINKWIEKLLSGVSLESPKLYEDGGEFILEILKTSVAKYKKNCDQVSSAVMIKFNYVKTIVSSHNR